MAKRRRRTSRRVEQPRARPRARAATPGTLARHAEHGRRCGDGDVHAARPGLSRERRARRRQSPSRVPARIGEVCDELNDNDGFRARDEKAVESDCGRPRPRSTSATRSSTACGERRHGLRTRWRPSTRWSLRTGSRRSVGRWSRRGAVTSPGYAPTRCRSTASTRAEARRRAEPARQGATGDARDSDTLRAGLKRLGEANCDLEPQVVRATYKLPPPKATPRPRPAPRPSPRLVPTATPMASQTPVAPPASPPVSPTQPPQAPPGNPPGMPNVPNMP